MKSIKSVSSALKESLNECHLIFKLRFANLTLCLKHFPTFWDSFKANFFSMSLIIQPKTIGRVECCDYYDLHSIYIEHISSLQIYKWGSSRRSSMITQHAISFYHSEDTLASLSLTSWRIAYFLSFYAIYKRFILTK